MAGQLDRRLGHGLKSGSDECGTHRLHKAGAERTCWALTFRPPPPHKQGHPHSGCSAPAEGRGGFRLWKPRGWPEGSEKRGESTRTRWRKRNRGPGDSKQGLFFRTLGRARGGGKDGVLLSLCLVPSSGCKVGQDFLPVPYKADRSAENPARPCSGGPPPATGPSCLPASQELPSFSGGGLKAIFTESTPCLGGCSRAGG